jgi:AcrR family transcriptional regulator
MAYELNGRIAQKRRTRDALITAARELVAQGATPTVEAVAEAASISRTTAYRYFPSQRALLAAAHPETAAVSLLPEDAPDDDVVTRLDLVVTAFVRITLDNEAQQRTMLRLSLEADEAERTQLPLRQGRGIKWIEEALAPLHSELSGPEVRRLAIAVRSAIGIESLVWLIDVAGLSRAEAADLVRSSARALLDAAVQTR